MTEKSGTSIFCQGGWSSFYALQHVEEKGEGRGEKGVEVGLS